MARLLLLSNSTMPGTPFFTWPRPHVKAFLGDTGRDLAFIPFAGVTLTFDEYAERVSEAFSAMEYRMRSVHNAKDAKALLRNAGAIVVGGGNTFALLSRMYEHDLMTTVQECVAGGTPYIGWSAGANLACPTLMTTNDMPVIMPPTFEALDLIPFQVNPHYHELKFENQGGETRAERLSEFLTMNPDGRVIGLPEGMFVRRENDILTLGGEGIAKLYEAANPVLDLPSGSDISYLIAPESTDLGAP